MKYRVLRTKSLMRMDVKAEVVALVVLPLRRRFAFAPKRAIGNWKTFASSHQKDDKEEEGLLTLLTLLLARRRKTTTTESTRRR